MAGAEVLEHEPVRGVPVVFAEQARGDRLAAGRTFAEGRHVQVAVQGQRQGARDRGGGEQQRIGVGAALAEFGALHHAETVLLVHDRQTQALEAHGVLNEGVRADDDVHLAAFQQAVHLLLAPVARLPGQQHQRHAQPLGQRRQCPAVLLGQQFGRRHERDLIAAVERGQRGEERHDGLPGPHVALHEAVHGMRRGHVAEDRRDHGLLRRGEAERQHVGNPAHERPGHAGQAGFPHAAAPAQRHAELQMEQLVEHHGTVCRRTEIVQLRHVGVQRRHVQRAQSVGERHQRQAAAHLRGHAVGHVCDVLLDRAVDEAAHRGQRHFVRLAVHGQDARGRRIVFERLHVGMHHPLAALPALFDLAVQQDALPELVALLEIAVLMIPEQEQEAGVVAHHGFQHPPPAAQKAPAHARDVSGDGHLRAELGRGDGRHLAPVLIAERHVVEQVFDRVDAEARELFGAPRADALDVLDRFLERRLRAKRPLVGRRRRRGGGSVRHTTPSASCSPAAPSVRAPAVRRGTPAAGALRIVPASGGRCPRPRPGRRRWS